MNHVDVLVKLTDVDEIPYLYEDFGDEKDAKPVTHYGVAFATTSLPYFLQEPRVTEALLTDTCRCSHYTEIFILTLASATPASEKYCWIERSLSNSKDGTYID